MKTIEILTRAECPKCGGYGAVENPIWGKYHSEHNLSMHTTEETIDWFSKQGCDYHEEQEEIPCTDCTGSGYITEWIKVDENLFRASFEVKLLKNALL